MEDLKTEYGLLHSKVGNSFKNNVQAINAMKP